MDIAKIAEVCHEVSKAYCEANGDFSQPSWIEAPDWQKSSVINGVVFHIKNPDAKPSASHDNWLAEKIADGWVYGEVKDPAKKQHPCCVPYDKLPMEQRAKDYIFTTIVRCLKD